MTVDTLIAGGDVVTATGRFTADVAIDDGTIVAVGDSSQLPDAEEKIDATGKLVMPGAVDPHVHIDEVPENRAGTYEAETAAAAVGGVTTFIDFAFQGGDRALSNEDETLLDGIANKRSNQSSAHVDYSLHGVLHRETAETLDEIDAAIEEGVTSFKMFLSNYKVGVTTGFVHQAFERIAENDAIALLHTENPSLCDSLTEELKAAGKGDPTYYPESRPDYAEAMAAEDAVRMAAELGTKYYGVHTTCEQSSDVIESFQDQANIRAETCVHYTTLDDSVYAEKGNLPKIAPPIRSSDDVEAIWDHLDRGTLSVVSTDHAVYHEEYKQVDDWWDAPLGSNSLQVSLPVFADEAVNERGYTYSDVVDLMCTTPARTFGFPEKGTLEPGTDADIVVFDPDASFTIDAADNYSNSTYSIYEGRTVRGAVEKTLLRGQTIAEDGELVGSPGDGNFLERDIPAWD